MLNKKLYLSPTNKKLAGVFGGLGEYFDIDPTLFRLIWILITVLTGIVPGIVIYILAWIIIPNKTLIVHESKSPDSEFKKSDPDAAEQGM